MAALYQESRLRQGHGRSPHEIVVDEIEGLIKVYKDGKVERSPIIPTVHCNAIPSTLGVVSRDVVIDDLTRLWGRVYVPTSGGTNRVPLVVYFHGGGFCVGSSAWSCYHDFLPKFVSRVNCVVLSVEYRLAPENRIPCAYADGFKSVVWISQQATIRVSNEHSWWLSRCNFSSFFLAGDSAGGNIAHNVAIRLANNNNNNTLKPLIHKGTILIQPFFGGGTRTCSEMGPQPVTTMLSLAASDAYWRLALPLGSNRDHPSCNPNVGVKLLKSIALPTTLVCISEMDILKDRNIGFCNMMVSSGKAVQMVMYRGVGHAFQILDNSVLSRTRLHEMMTHLKNFIIV